MKKNNLGKTNIKVTPIGFGALTIGPWQLNLPVKKGADILKYALSQGVNFVDTAQYYLTYPYIKEALKGYTGDVVIASKSLDFSYNEMKYAVEECRKEISRDVIDIFMLHEVRHGMDWEYRAGAWEYLQEAKSKGIVKAIGISTHHVDVAEFAATVKEIDVLFPIINYKSMGIRHGDFEGKKEDMENAIISASDAGKGIFAMKVFGGGNLVSNYHTALDYALNLKGVDSLMVGFSNTEEVDKMIEKINGTLLTTYEPNTKLKKVRIDQGDCMRCHKCVDRCPNKAIYVTKSGSCDINHEKCLTCGYCAPVCEYLAIIMF